MSEKPKRTIRATRRRRTASSAPREQAAAPTRDHRPDAPSSAPPPPPRPPSGGGAPAAMPSMPALPIGRGGKLGCLVLFLILLCLGLFLLPRLFGGGSGPSPAPQQPVSQPTTAPAEATPTSMPIARPPAATGEGDTWLVMLYQDADDKILEKDIVIDLNEAERAGSSDRVQIVSQVDRYRGGFRGDGNWTSTKRFYVTYDPDLNRLASKEIMDVGEANMADGGALVDFVQWAVDAYPADHYVLILSDHGMGWPGGWSDPTARGRGPDAIPLADALGDRLFLTELDRALAEIQRTTDIDQFELIGLDACLMAQAEVYEALRPYARYAVASQETEPAVGWAYAGFLRELLTNPDSDGATLGKNVVDTYIQEDARILDDQARAEMVGRGPSARQVMKKMYSGATLSAVDLAAYTDLMDALNHLAYTLQDADQKAVAKARSYAQAYTSVFGRNARPSYIDLGNFVRLLQRETNDSGVKAAGDEVIAALDRAVVAETHGRNKSGSNGVSIYFPTSDLYFNRAAGAASYAVTADRFARNSLWDDFLAYHYTGRRFEAKPGGVPPQPTPQAPPPGAGHIRVSPIHLSAKTVSPGESVLVSADIEGENIGYIYLFTGMFDPQARSLFVADMDFLQSGADQTVDGVTYPDWGEGAFTLEFEWEPLFFGINDGQHTVTALFSPERYGVNSDDAVYTVDGIYTYGEDGETRNARLYFDNATGQLKQVFGYTDDDFTGAAREILPQPGDSFTVLETWYDLDEQGRTVRVASESGGTVTFGDTPLEWRELDAPPGEYQIGFIIEDLDGRRTPVFANIVVK